MPRLSNSIFSAMRSVLTLLFIGNVLQTSQPLHSIVMLSTVKSNEHLRSQIGSAAVTRERSLLKSLFRWLLNPGHLPVKAGLRPKRKAMQRAYRTLLRRVAALKKRFPSENAPLISIGAIISERARALTETRDWVSYRSKDGGYSWYAKKGVQPAWAPRLTLAVCIAKVLHPRQSPYILVAEELGRQGVRLERRAIEMQVHRLLDKPEKYHVYGAGPVPDPLNLLIQEFVAFKVWTEDQSVDRTTMSVEEFDAQYSDYLDRIHSTPEERALFGRLLDNFRKSRNLLIRPRIASGGDAKSESGVCASVRRDGERR